MAWLDLATLLPCHHLAQRKRLWPDLHFFENEGVVPIVMAKLQVFEGTATHHNKGFQVNAKMLIKTLAELAKAIQTTLSCYLLDLAMRCLLDQPAKPTDPVVLNIFFARTP